MKINFLVFAFFCIFIYVSKEPANCQIDTSKIIDDYLLEKPLSNQWDKLHDYWMDSVYWQILSKNKLKMTCAHCTSIYMLVVFSIDSVGKVNNCIIERENICSQKASEKLRKQFLEYWMNQIFVPPLRNIKIRTRLGTGLKC